MSEPLIRRRSLPDSLRYLARKLEEPLSDAERAGVALTLNSLADEAEAGRNAIAHELAERQRKAIEGFDLDDHWAVYYRVSDVESLPDLIDPSAGPVRPDEEATA